MGCKIDLGRQNVIFEHWRQRPPHSERTDFVTDGPVDPDRWRDALRRVLFLTKEAYGGGGDLAGWMREKGPSRNFSWQIGYWNYGVQRLEPCCLPPNPYPKRAWEKVRDAFMESAVVNIKKSNGQRSSNNEDLRWYVERDWRLIKKQVKCLCPDVVICCSNWRLVKDHLWPTAELTSERVWRSGGLWLVDYWHPSNHYPTPMKYYCLMALLQQALFPEGNRPAKP